MVLPILYPSGKGRWLEVAIGYDEGSVTIKLGREEPAVSSSLVLLPLIVAPGEGPMMAEAYSSLPAGVDGLDGQGSVGEALGRAASQPQDSRRGHPRGPAG